MVLYLFRKESSQRIFQLKEFYVIPSNFSIYVYMVQEIALVVPQLLVDMRFDPLTFILLH